MTDIWPWLAFAGLGAFHGLNPAMGWLFAVALGLHRQSRRVVVISLVPIAIGHAVSVAAVAGLLVVAGALVPHGLVRVGAGALLLGWAAYHWRFGHRHRVRFGMLVGFGGLAAWSFLMATAHGAGLMLWPALLPVCLASETGGGIYRRGGGRDPRRGRHPHAGDGCNDRPPGHARARLARPRGAQKSLAQCRCTVGIGAGCDGRALACRRCELSSDRATPAAAPEVPQPFSPHAARLVEIATKGAASRGAVQ